MRSYFQVAEYGSLFFTSLCWLVSLSRKLPIQFSLSLPAHATFRLNLPKENILNSWNTVQISPFLWTLPLQVQAELRASCYIFQKSLNIMYVMFNISHTELYAFEAEHIFLNCSYFSLFNCNMYMEMKVINTC